MNKRTLTNYEIFDYVYKIHSRQQDFDEGDLEDRIYKFSKYILTKLPVKRLYEENNWQIDDHKVKKYINLGSTLPPIVYDKVNYEIIDGSHRVAVAYQRGLKFINAYVGTKENLTEY